MSISETDQQVEMTESCTSWSKNYVQKNMFSNSDMEELFELISKVTSVI